MTSEQAQAEWEAKRRAHLDRHAAQQRARTRKMRHKVYRYTWADGMVYVGVTKRTLRHRENTHRRQCSVVGHRRSRRLGRRLDGNGTRPGNFGRVRRAGRRFGTGSP